MEKGKRILRVCSGFSLVALEKRNSKEGRVAFPLNFSFMIVLRLKKVFLDNICRARVAEGRQIIWSIQRRYPRGPVDLDVGPLCLQARQHRVGLAAHVGDVTLEQDRFALTVAHLVVFVRDGNPVVVE